MTRQHHLAINNIDRPVNNITLLIGAEADRERGPSSQLSTQSDDGASRGAQRSISYEGAELHQGHPSNEMKKRDSAVMSRLQIYNRLMHTHTKSQMANPGKGTLPCYQKAMHAFTLNQLNDSQGLSKSVCNSPGPAKNQALLRAVAEENSKVFQSDEKPYDPPNSPDVVIHSLR